MTKVLAVKPSHTSNFSITLIQLKVLAHLSSRKAGMKFGEIKSFLNRSKSQVSMLLSTLENKDLINRIGKKPQINIITKQGVEITKREVRDILPSLSDILINNTDMKKANKTPIWQKKLILNEKINGFLSQLNTSLINQITQEFKGNLKAELSEKLTQLLLNDSKPQVENTPIEVRTEKVNANRTDLFEKFIQQVEKIIKYELKDSLERLPEEIVQDIQRAIINKIHDKLYEFF